MGIWDEPWLLDDREPTIQTLPMCGLETAKVCSLKSTDGKNWDGDILNDLSL